MRRLRSRRGALSYILSVIMMALVTTSLATVVLLWGLGQVSESQSSFESAIRARIDKAQERILVEDVEVIDSTTVRISVRNVGKVMFTVDKVYINHTSVNVPSRLTLGVRELGRINATTIGLFNLLPDHTYSFVVSTTRGTTYAGYFKY